MQKLLRIKRRIWALAVAVITVVVTFTYLSGRRYVSAVESVQHTLEVTKLDRRPDCSRHRPGDWTARVRC